MMGPSKSSTLQSILEGVVKIQNNFARVDESALRALDEAVWETVPEEEHNARVCGCEKCREEMRNILGDEKYDAMVDERR